MEILNERKNKRRDSVRKAVKKYTDGLKTNDPEKYQELIKYHREYNKLYYQKLKEDRRKLHQLLQQKSD